MKGLRKNIYAVTVIVLFAIALGMLVLFLALFSSSTSVDSTTVGSVYVGDEKPNTDARKKKLIAGVNNWKDKAIYTITFQNVTYRIGDIEKINPETGEVETELYDKVSNSLVRKVEDEDTKEITYIKIDDNGNDVIDEKTNKPVTVLAENVKKRVIYEHMGLTILDFNYEETNRKIVNDTTSNIAYFNFSNENKQLLFNDLVKTYGSRVTDDDYFIFQDLVDAIMEDAQNMKTKADYDLYDFLADGWRATNINQIEITSLSKNKVDEISGAFTGVQIELPPQKSEEGKLGFSTIDFLSQPEYSSLSSSDMSIVATGLAAVVQNTSLTVTVKNQGYISDRYYAYDDMTARVNIKDDTDLRIINPETHSYYITIVSGNSEIDGKLCLKFILEGCKFVNEYKVTKTEKIIDHQVVYDSASSLFTYDEDDPNMGIDTTYEGGCYYNIYQEGRDSYLYSYKKTITYVDGTTEEVEVYPKQEFFSGQDELRQWTKKGYIA